MAGRSHAPKAGARDPPNLSAWFQEFSTRLDQGAWADPSNAVSKAPDPSEPTPDTELSGYAQWLRTLASSLYTEKPEGQTATEPDEVAERLARFNRAPGLTESRGPNASGEPARPDARGAARAKADRDAREKSAAAKARSKRKHRTPDERLRQARRRILRLGIVLFVTVGLSPVFARVSPQHGYAVATDSMEPRMPQGTFVWVGSGTIEAGDVIAYRSVTGAVQIHRVAELRQVSGKSYYLTRGDANTAADAFLVPPEDVRGVAKFHAPYVGYLWLLPDFFMLLAFCLAVFSYLGITAWDAREALLPVLLGSRAAVPLAAAVVLILLVPSGFAGVGGLYPESGHSFGVAPSPVPHSAGSMGNATIWSDNNIASTTVGPPYLWKEIVMWGCQPDGDCLLVPPNAYQSWDGSITRVDTANYDGSPEYYLEAVLVGPGAGNNACVQLRNKTDAATVAGSEICTNSTSPTRVRSGALALAGAKDYVFQYMNSGLGSGGTVMTVKILTRQLYPTKTETQVFMSGADWKTNDDVLTTARRSIRYLNDDDAWTPIGTIYLEFVANNTGVGNGRARIRDVTNGNNLGSTGFDTATITRFRSAAINPSDERELEFQFRSDNDPTSYAFIWIARLIIIQSATVTQTVRYVDLSWNATTTNTGSTSVGFDARYHMDEEWGNRTAYFEATLENSDAAGTTYARLVDRTAAATVVGSEVSLAGTAMDRARSGALTLNAAAGDYAAEFNSSVGTNTAKLRNAVLIVFQAPGKWHDDVLRTDNDATSMSCSFTLAYRAAGSGNLGRLNSGTRISIRAQGGPLSDEIILGAGGTVSQSEGSAVSVPAGSRLEHVVFSDPSSSGTSTIKADLKGTCGVGVHTTQDLTFVLG